MGTIDHRAALENDTADAALSAGADNFHGAHHIVIEDRLAAPEGIDKSKMTDRVDLLITQEFGEQRVAHVSLDEIHSLQSFGRGLDVETKYADPLCREQAPGQPPAPIIGHAGNQHNFRVTHIRFSISPLLWGHRRCSRRKKSQPNAPAATPAAAPIQGRNWKVPAAPFPLVRAARSARASSCSRASRSGC